MPLSIYVLLVKQNNFIDGLQELLDDPERRHIPLGDLPINIRKQLFNRSAALTIEHLCIIMSAMGLMRCAPPFEGRPNVMGPHVSLKGRVIYIRVLGSVLLWQKSLFLRH
jgi:hypothetical protein